MGFDSWPTQWGTGLDLGERVVVNASIFTLLGVFGAGFPPRFAKEKVDDARLPAPFGTPAPPKSPTPPNQLKRGESADSGNEHAGSHYSPRRDNGGYMEVSSVSTGARSPD